MALPVTVNSEVSRAYYARDLDGQEKTGLILADFDVDLTKKESGDPSFVTAPEFVTLVELDPTILPGQYDFRFTPTLEATYSLQVVPLYPLNLGDRFRELYDARADVALDLGTAFCTVAQVRGYLGDVPAEEDTRLDDVVSWVSGYIRKRCGRFILERSITRLLDGEAYHVIVLPEYPIAESAVIEVWESTTIPRVYDATTLLVEGTDYFVDRESGRLWRIGGRWPFGPHTVKVSIDKVGEASVPAELNGAAVRMAGLIYMQRKRLGHSSEAGVETTSSFYDFRQWPKDVEDVLRAYGG